MSEPLDAETLRRAQRGEAEACRALVERYQDEVFALVGDEATAEATFAAVLAALPRYSLGAERLGAWVMTIAARRKADALDAGGARPGTGEPGRAPAGFADRVVAEAARTPRVEPARGPRLGLAAVVVVVACAGAVIVALVRAPTRPAIPASVPGGRTVVPLGARGVAVAERGAVVTFVAGKVAQGTGRAFYRIERGEPLVITTPHGELRTESSCLHVEVLADSTVVTIDEGYAVVGGSPVTAGARSVLR